MISSNIPADEEQYVQQIEKQYQQAMDLVALMRSDTKAIEDDTAGLRGFGGGSIEDDQYFTQYLNDPTDENLRLLVHDLDMSPNEQRKFCPMIEDIAAKQQEIRSSQAKLEALDPGLKALDDTLNTLLNGLGTASEDTVSQDFSEDLRLLSNAIDHVMDAIRDRVQVDECEQLIQGGGTSDADLAYAQGIAGQMMQAAYDEQSVLSALVPQLISSIEGYHKTQKESEANENNIHWWNELPGQSGSADKAHDEEEKRRCGDMIKILTDVSGSIVDEMATLDPDMVNVVLMLGEILKRMISVLSDTSLSAGEKKTEIMKLFVIAMGLLSLVQQYATKDKTSSENIMAEASASASVMAMEDTKTEQQEMADDKRYAKIMGIIMKVAECVAGAVMTLLAPGMGTALMMAALTVLTGTGVMDKLTSTLADKMGQVGADCLMAGLEIVVTAGGGAVADALLKSALKAASREVAEVLTQKTAQIVAESTLKVVAKSGEALTEDAEKLLSEQISHIVKEAGKKAMKKMFTQYFKSGGVKLLVENLAKKGDRLAVGRIAQEAMKEAAEGAERKAASMIEEMLSVNSEGALLDGTGAPALATGIEEKAANESVAKITSATAKKVAKETADQSAGKLALARTGWTIGYSLGGNNILTDLATQLQKDHKDMNDKSFNDLMIFLKVFQTIVSMIMEFKGIGATTQLDAPGGVANLMKWSSYLQLPTTLADSIGNFGTYDAESAESRLVPAIAQTKAESTLISALQEDLVRWLKAVQESDMKKQAAFAESTADLAANLYRGDAAVSQALATAV